MMKKTLALSLVLVMALSFTACNGEPLPTVEEIIEGMTQAMTEVRTGEFEMEMAMDMDVEAEGESIDVNLEADASGAMDMEDVENMQMQMDMSMHAATTGEEDIDI